MNESARACVRSFSAKATIPVNAPPPNLRERAHNRGPYDPETLSVPEVKEIICYPAPFTLFSQKDAIRRKT